MSLGSNSLKSSLTVGLFQSLSFCGLRSKILKNIAFQPPPVSYVLRPRAKVRQSLRQTGDFQVEADLRKKSQSYDEEKLVEELDLYHLHDELAKAHSQSTLFQSTKHEPKDPILYPKHDFILIDGGGKEVLIPEQESLSLTGYFLPWKKGKRMASLFIKVSNPASEYILLFSHGNASDLGLMIDTLIDLANNLNINVFAYEYPGYGQSSGSPSDINVIKCIKLGYQFLVQELGFHATKIIVYGYSIGSGPSVTLSADENYPIGGLVVHSGLSSGLRVVKQDMQKTPFYDIFPNVDLIKNVQCPIFIMHGKEDEVIGLEHAKLLANNSSRLFELWEVENMGHGGIDTDNDQRKNYFYKLRNFLKLIQKENQTMEDLLERNKASPLLKQQKHYYDTKLATFSLSQQLEKQKDRQNKLLKKCKDKESNRIDFQGSVKSIE